MFQYSGTTGAAVTVSCVTGYSGGGTARCGINGQFNTLTCVETASGKLDKKIRLLIFDV